ncbi:hypothetical protein ACJIZ3_021552 [Penstemon smallii]|uniref:Cytochrome P450 n=1 Tax=Penstemon smallii TaxID=265156 RepID=A0ABD3SMQ7_9LAMI
MELFYVSLLITLFVLLVSLLVGYKNKSSTTPGPFPPGNTGWPIVGESLEFLSTVKKGHPERFIFDRIAKYSSLIFRTHLLGEPFAVFCGANANKFLFTNENKLVQCWCPSSITKLFPSVTQTSFLNEEIIKKAKLMSNFLRPEALQRYVGIMDDIARRNFADGWEHKKEVVTHTLVNKYTFSTACRLFVSIEDQQHVDEFAEPFNLFLSGMYSIPVNLPGTTFNKAMKASNFIREQLISIVKQRKIDLAQGKASPNQDLLSHMLLTSDENGKFIPELDIADMILGFLVGGHDNVSSACTLIVYYLAELPEIYQGVFKEQMGIANSKALGELLNWDDIQKMKYSWNVAREVLRIAPSILSGFKVAIKDFMYNGFSIPKGNKLYWSTNSTHKNPECFPEPKKFDPSRFEGSGPAPYTFIPFGGGPRICPGQEYARLEILVFMHHLVKRFKFEKIIPDEKIVANPISIPAKGLPIRLHPHKN